MKRFSALAFFVFLSTQARAELPISVEHFSQISISGSSAEKQRELSYPGIITKPEGSGSGFGAKVCLVLSLDNA